MTIEEKLMLGYPLETGEAHSLAELPLLELARRAQEVRTRLHADLVAVQFGAEPHRETFPATGGLDASIDQLLALRQAGHPAVAPVVAQQDLMTTGEREIRLIALARLILDTVPHIVADWARLTPATAQLALRCGADGLCGLPPGLPPQEIERHIRDAGLELAAPLPAPMGLPILA
jgi:aminodeoxyfutalosine synthase